MTDVNAEILDTMIGRQIESWSEGDDGIHFRLSDGKMAIISGSFWIAVVSYADDTVH